MNKASLKRTVSAVVVAATIATLSPLGVSAQWRQNTDSTWNYTEGNKIAQGWENISDIWYYFNSYGKMNTGWICDKGTWYYNNNSGAMQTGWIKDNGKWYYADSTGAMQIGIIKINEKTYCLNSSGSMLVGTINIGNKLYEFDSNGQAIGTIPQCSKEFNSNGNIVVKPTIEESNEGSNENGSTDTTAQNDTNNNQESNENSSVDTTLPSNISENQNSNVTSGTGSITTNSTSTTVDVNGLLKLPQNYDISVQAAAENKIFELMNQKRTEAGLQPLTMDNTLLQVARYKSNHMIQYNYFDHTNPDGTKWTDWLKAIDYKYTTTGENIAYNTYDAVELFNQWWNSPGHRANMMNASYTKVGVGVVNGNGKYMGTQEFSN